MSKVNLNPNPLKQAKTGSEPLIKRILRSPWYPGILQWPTLLVFNLVIWQLLWGPKDAHDNFGTAMTWVIWWPVIPIFFMLLGRFWCAVCPFATISDLFQKWFGTNLPVPRWLKKYGIWIIDIAFIVITWADHVYGIVESPRGSGYLLLIIFTGVVVAGVLFSRRTWCRYLCFLGGLSGNYSRAAVVELRATPEVCKNCRDLACYKGNEKAPGCPMFEVPRTMDSNALCNFCGYCVKSCPNDSITIKTRPATKELWFIRRPKLEESFLAVVIMGIVFVQNITMLDVWDTILKTLEKLAGTDSYFVTFTITFILAMSLTVAAMWFTSFFSARGTGERAWSNFAKFGYAIIPLDLAGHVAHNLFHLLSEGLAVVFTGMALLGMEVHDMSPAILGDEAIQILQYSLIVLGTVASLYTAKRIAVSNYQEKAKAGKAFLPYLVFILLLGVINAVLFYLPMAHRM
ncbi:MAG: 4Fe-4S binding protein [Bacillota bacterium]